MTYQTQFAAIGAALDEEFAKIADQLDNPVDPIDPDPGPEPEPTPPSTGLPAQVLSTWHHCWNGPLPWAGYPTDVQSKLNFMSLGLCQSAGAGTGKLRYYNRFGDSLKPAIVAARNKGKRTIMGVGGASDGGITITNDTQVNEAFNSLVSMVDSYGISGLDIDLEPSGSGWNESSLVKLADKLLAKYPDFIIGITPGLYGTHTARWMSLGKALGNRYQFMAPMLYDFPEAGDNRLINVALDKCRIMKDGGVPESKMILGFMSRPAGQAYPNATPNPQICQDAYNACKQRYPGLRGVFHWEDAIDNGNGWAWTRKMSL